MSKKKSGPAANQEYVWLVTDFGFPSMPHVSRYVFHKKAPSGKGVIVKERGGTHWLGAAEYFTVCWTKDEVKELVKGILAERKKRAEEVLAAVAEYDKVIPVNEVSPDPWPEIELKLD